MQKQRQQTSGTSWHQPATSNWLQAAGAGGRLQALATQVQQRQQQPNCATLITCTQNNQSSSLVDLLIDSHLEWRQLIGDANRPQVLADHLSEQQLKRQQIVHELIQTERHHCLTLALMRQVYLGGLLKLNEFRLRAAKQLQATNEAPASLECQGANQQQQAEPIDLERLFPALEELVQAHELFFAHLRLRLVECCSISPSGESRAGRLIGIVGPIGDLLLEQFRLNQKQGEQQEGANEEQAGLASRTSQAKLKGQQKLLAQKQVATNGRKLLAAYVRFCGQQLDSSKYYKQLIEHDREFKLFIEVSLPSCFLPKLGPNPSSSFLISRRRRRLFSSSEQRARRTTTETLVSSQQANCLREQCWLARGRGRAALLSAPLESSSDSTGGHSLTNRSARRTIERTNERVRLWPSGRNSSPSRSSPSSSPTPT